MTNVGWWMNVLSKFFNFFLIQRLYLSVNLPAADLQIEIAVGMWKL